MMKKFFVFLFFGPVLILAGCAEMPDNQYQFGFDYEHYAPREYQGYQQRPVIGVPAYRAYLYESSQESARPRRRY
ncbi:MAG: hypothetical protein ACYC8S_02060 [Minisyncoccota bacterium]